MRCIAKKVDFKWIKNRPMHSVSTKKQASERMLNCRKFKKISCSCDKHNPLAADF